MANTFDVFDNAEGDVSSGTPNPFDVFDTKPVLATSNTFDQFDALAAPAVDPMEAQASPASPTPRQGLPIPESTHPGDLAFKDKLASDAMAKAEKESALQAGARRAAFGTAPTVAGLAGGALGAKGGAMAGGAIGTMIAPGPGTAIGMGIGGLAGAIIGGGGAAIAARKGQDALLESVAPEQMAQWQAEMQAAEQVHPVASFVGDMAPQLIGLKPSFKNVASAFRGAKFLLSGADDVIASPAGRAMMEQLANVGIGAGVEGAQEAYEQYQKGEFNGGRLLARITIAAVVNEPNKFGVRLGLHPSTGEIDVRPPDAALPDGLAPVRAAPDVMPVDATPVKPAIDVPSEIINAPRPAEAVQATAPEIIARPVEPPTQTPVARVEGEGVGTGTVKPPELMTPDEWIAEHTRRLSPGNAEIKELGKRMGIEFDGAQPQDTPHRNLIRNRMLNGDPVSSDAVDAYGLKKPDDGYVKEGDRYVYKPDAISPPPAEPINAAKATRTDEGVVSSTVKPYTVKDAKYAKGKKAVVIPGKDGMKTREARLAGAINKERYSNREGAYIMSKAQAAKFEKMNAEGWDASVITGELIPPDAATKSLPVLSETPKPTVTPEEAHGGKFDVGEKVLWRTATGEDAIVNWRGSLRDDMAVVVTDKGYQTSVPSERLRKQGAPYRGPDNNVLPVREPSAAKPAVEVLSRSEAQSETPIPTTREGLIDELQGKEPADVSARLRWRDARKAWSKFTKSELTEKVIDTRTSKQRDARMADDTSELIPALQKLADEAGARWRTVLKQYVESRGARYVLMTDWAKGDAVYYAARRLAEHNAAKSKATPDVPFQTTRGKVQGATLPAQRATTRTMMEPLGGKWTEGASDGHIGTWTDGKGTTIDFRHADVASPTTGPRAGETAMGMTQRTGRGKYTVTVDAKNGDITTPPHELAEIVGMAARNGMSEPYHRIVRKAIGVDLSTPDGAHQFAVKMETQAGRNKIADDLLKAAPGAQSGFRKWINGVIRMVNRLFGTKVAEFIDPNFKTLANGMRDFTALKELASIDNTQTTAYQSKPSIQTTDPVAQSAADNMARQRDQVKESLKSDLFSFKKLRDIFGSQFVDYQAPIFRRLRIKAEKSGPAAQNAVAEFERSFHAIRGASGRAANRISDVAEAMHKSGIRNKADLDFFNDVRQAQRTIEVDTVHRIKAGQEKLDLIASGGGWNAADETAYLAELNNFKSPLSVAEAKQFLREAQQHKLWGKVDTLNERFRTEYYANVDAKVAEGIISRKLGDYLKKHVYYQPRVFIDKFDPVVDPGKSGRLSIHDSGVQSLKSGSEKALLNDSIWLLGRDMQHSEGIIARNQANRELYNIVKSDPTDNALGARLVANEAQPAPEGMTRISHRENGKTVSIDMPTELAQYMRTSDPALARFQASMIKHLTGVSTVKALATSLNPEFALPNFFRDMGLSWLATKNYNSFLPIAVAQQTRNFIRQMNPTIRKKLLDQYIKYGGSTEYLSTQQFLTPMNQAEAVTTGRRAVSKTIKAMGWLSNQSEEAGRLMVVDQSLRKQGVTINTANEAQWKIAVHEASNYMDFRQSGQMTKVLDQFIPFVNPAFQGVRAVTRAFKERPAQTTAKAAQIMALGAYVAWWNRKNNDKAWESTSDQDKNTKAMFALPMQTKDKNGVARYANVALPIDQGWRPFFVLGQMMAEKFAGKDIDAKRLADVTYANYAPIDLANLPPNVAALLTYKLNKDFWRNEDVWRGRKVEPSAERRISTPETANKIGDITGLSPERLTAAASKLIPQNPWSHTVSSAVDWFGQPKDADVQEDNFSKWARLPMIRKVIRLTSARELRGDDLNAARRLRIPTYDKAPAQVLNEIDKATVKQNTYRQGNDLKFDKMIAELKAGKITKSDLLRAVQRTKDARGRADIKEIARIRRRLHDRYPALNIPAPRSRNA